MLGYAIYQSHDSSGIQFGLAALRLYMLGYVRSTNHMLVRAALRLHMLGYMLSTNRMLVRAYPYISFLKKPANSLETNYAIWDIPTILHHWYCPTAT